MNRFASYFLTKIVNIRRELDSQHVNANSLFHDSQYVNVPKLSSLRIATQDPSKKLETLIPVSVTTKPYSCNIKGDPGCSRYG